VDRSLLPDIFALTVFIVGFRPLARRVGPHANLWFLGWGFVLLHHLVLLFNAPGGVREVVVHTIAVSALDLCALTFLMVTANVPTERIRLPLLAGMAVPVLLQTWLYTLGVTMAAPEILACLLFLWPAAHLVARKRERNRQANVVAGAFAVFGLASIWIEIHNPQLVTRAALSLLFFSAAYLFFGSAERYSRGVISGTVGLAGWGLSYPIVAAFQHYHPGIVLDHTITELPQYLVIAGTILTLLERMAMHDPLTDLPNRRMFEERLIATMEEARINRTTVACLVIDVDNFKTINDTLGHSAGDQLLRALAVRLSWHMSPRDILARTGGDEFTALLAGVSDEHHLRFIASAMMSAGSVPISIDGKSVDVRISIGIALSPDHADDIDSLRRAADLAMYSAKRRGGSMLAFADEQ
jgi:diguanylate cyclase (GGDEF)-like protein